MRAARPRPCPDCGHSGYPACAAQCPYCIAVLKGDMVSLEDRILNPKLSPDLTITVGPSEGERII